MQDNVDGRVDTAVTAAQAAAQANFKENSNIDAAPLNRLPEAACWPQK